MSSQVDNSNAGTSTSTANTPPDTTSVPPNGTIGPGEIILTERFLSDPIWPQDLTLSLDQSNWAKWNKWLTLLTEGQGFSAWLSRHLQQPNISTHPKAHWIWNNNDISLHTFILRHISPIEYKFLGQLVKDSSSHSIYEQLKQCHEKLGL